jgi:hypothetical protein
MVTFFSTHIGNSARLRLRSSSYGAALLIMHFHLFIPSTSFAENPTRVHAQDTDSRPTPHIQCHISPFRGQVWAWLTSGSTEYMCLADGISFDNFKETLDLVGDALVEVKEQPKLYSGHSITINATTGNIIINRPLSTGPPHPAQQRLDDSWTKYKVEFLVRTALSIEVLTLSASQSDPLPFVIDDGASIRRVLECRTLFGDKDEHLTGHLANLFPPTEVTKVFLVDYHGQELRNWIPYDKNLEAKILAFRRQHKIR